MVLALVFAGLIIAGAAILSLPISATQPLRWIDALFMATSAVTVTGLSVIDVGTGLTRFGQVVLLVLIQLGGLGMMTFTVMVLSLLGLRLSIRQQMLLKEDLNQTSLGDLMRLVRMIAGVVAIMEAIGTVLLAARFVPPFGWSEGLFCALFHAISAFNNAGFSLFPDSWTRWATDWWSNLVITALVIVGGLGFSVLDDLRARRRWTYLSLHSRLTLAGTAVLLALGFVGFALLEWHNPKTLGLQASVANRLLASFFQSAMTRSGGFNTIDIASLHDSTTLLFVGLMFIGGGSTSNAGGIKVSSFMVLAIVTWAFLRKSDSPSAFGRTIPTADVLKVLALCFISSSIVVFGTFALTVIQTQPFLDLLFETVSALATVGLSRGITGELHDPARMIVTVMMFIGRIGPLTLGLTLARNMASRLRYPEGRVYLG